MSARRWRDPVVVAVVVGGTAAPIEQVRRPVTLPDLQAEAAGVAAESGPGQCRPQQPPAQRRLLRRAPARWLTRGRPLRTRAAAVTCEARQRVYHR